MKKSRMGRWLDKKRQREQREKERRDAEHAIWLATAKPFEERIAECGELLMSAPRYNAIVKLGCP